MNASPTITHGEEVAADQDEPGSCPAEDADRPPEPEPTPDTHDASPTGSGPDVSVSVLPGVSRIPDTEWLERRLRDVAGAIDHPISRVSVLIVDDGRMAEFHCRHLGIDETTDVLTFPTSPEEEAIDVDIVICMDEAIRQAERQGHRVEQELLLYALHGMLHCAGFDDHDETGYRAMHEEEDRLLRAIGVGATFKGSLSGHDADCPNADRDTGAER